MQIITTNEWGRTDVFEVVEEVPTGFYVWPIGKHAPEGYVPLCESLPDDEWKVNLDTLKAIRSDHAEEILKAAICGGKTLEKCEKAVNGRDAYAAERCAAALPYMQEITWN